MQPPEKEKETHEDQNEEGKEAKYKNARCLFMFLANRHIKSIPMWETTVTKTK